LPSKEGERGLKAGGTIPLAGIKETLENPLLVISDHDEKRRPAMSYIRSYNFNNDRGQICDRLLKVIVTTNNIVVSSYFVDYDNIRKLILDGEKILKQ
jgi:cell division protein FtsI/penicillin-binding protein 2